MLHLRSLGLGLDEEGSAIPVSLPSFSFSSSVGILLCFDLCSMHLSNPNRVLTVETCGDGHGRKYFFWF